MKSSRETRRRHTHYADADPYTTKDGSLIRELMHPDRHGVRTQSLAEAIVAPGATTALHRHRTTEELYHVVTGKGTMTLNDERREVHAGDTMCIPPGAAHCIANTGNVPLRILCCCTPAYSHDDTELL